MRFREMRPYFGEYGLLEKIWMILCFLIGFSKSLLCYDSSFPSPHSTQECGEGKMCYQEYYAIEREESQERRVVEQYFERFCVSKRECHLRGFHGICTHFKSFDSAIKETFEKFRLRPKGVNRTALIHSKFCCCDTPLCNSFDVQAAQLEFQLTSSSFIHNFSPLIIFFSFLSIIQQILPI